MFLKKYGLKFVCYSPKIDETPHKNEAAKRFVKRMSSEKASEIQKSFPELPHDVIILAGDTIVFFDDKILGKPESAEHAYTMLEQLSGQTHQVFSGFSILNKDSGEEITDVICTEVRFQKLDDEMLEWYVNSGEAFGKAGAYSIQGLGAILVESISGSYNNVVGFPIERIIPHLTANAWISFAEKEIIEVSA
jgi:septum formation protein|tara:strand:+ start:99 stop:674 length:576 start_codon:yes stop_codon:yes gene_type:complete